MDFRYDEVSKQWWHTEDTKRCLPGRTGRGEDEEEIDTLVLSSSTLTPAPLLMNVFKGLALQSLSLSNIAFRDFPFFFRGLNVSRLNQLTMNKVIESTPQIQAIQFPPGLRLDLFAAYGCTRTRFDGSILRHLNRAVEMTGHYSLVDVEKHIGHAPFLKHPDVNVHFGYTHQFQMDLRLAPGILGISIANERWDYVSVVRAVLENCPQIHTLSISSVEAADRIPADQILTWTELIKYGGNNITKVQMWGVSIKPETCLESVRNELYGIRTLREIHIVDDTVSELAEIAQEVAERYKIRHDIIVPMLFAWKHQPTTTLYRTLSSEFFRMLVDMLC